MPIKEPRKRQLSSRKKTGPHRTQPGDALLLKANGLRFCDLPLPPASVDHSDSIAAFNRPTIEGLTDQGAFCRVTGQADVMLAEVENQIDVPVVIHILLVATRFSGPLVHVCLTCPLKGHGSVVNRHGIVIIGCAPGCASAVQLPLASSSS